MYIPSNITIRRGSSALFICIFDYMLAKSSRIKEKRKEFLHGLTTSLFLMIIKPVLMFMISSRIKEIENPWIYHKAFGGCMRWQKKTTSTQMIMILISNYYYNYCRLNEKLKIEAQNIGTFFVEGFGSILRVSYETLILSYSSLLIIHIWLFQCYHAFAKPIKLQWNICYSFIKLLLFIV